MKKGLEDNISVGDTGTPELDLESMFREAQKGNKTEKEKLVIMFMPYVEVQAVLFAGKGVPYEDLVQEGCFGLLEAIDKYDPTRNVSFHTYSIYYIKKYIRKALITQNIPRPIVYKEDFYYELMQYHRALNNLKEKLERQPTEAELAEEMKTTVFRIKKLQQRSYTFLPQEMLYKECTRVRRRVDFERYSESAENTALDHMSCIDLSFLNIRLTRREEEVLCRHFGITEGGEPESFSEIAKNLGYSYETIRATYVNAIQRIKRAYEAKETKGNS